MWDGDRHWVDESMPPFDQLSGVHRLAPERSGRASWTHARHQLYAARHKTTHANVLVKLTSKPGVVYEKDLANEIATLQSINDALPASRHFPVLMDHGRLRDGRRYLTVSLFDEWPLATTIVASPTPPQRRAHLQTMIEATRVVADLHAIQIWHVDLNPINILARRQGGAPVVRIVDFESSYDVARYSGGMFYDPPTTPGFSAPELPGQPPDARSDVFSLGAVLYTLLAGYEWTRVGHVGRCIEADRDLAPRLKDALLAAVAPEPAERFQSTGDFGAALICCLDDA